MKTKIRKYAKAFIALALSIAMISEAWGGLSFVSEAETTTPPDEVEVGTEFPADYSNYNFAEGDEYYITTAEQLVYFGRACRGGQTFEGITIHLAANIDYATSSFAKYNFARIGKTDAPFSGKFDGHGYKISNLKGPLFGYVENAIVEDFVLDQTTMTTTSAGCAMVVSMYNGTSNQIKDVTVSNSNAVISAENFGIVVGTYTDSTAVVAIEGCTVDNCTITNSTNQMVNIGGLAGSISAGSSITDCTVSNTKITGTYASATEYSQYIGGVVGYVAGAVTATNVTVDNVDITLGTVFNYVAGFAGYVTGDAGSTFTGCTVKNVDISGSAQDTKSSGKNYYNHVAGFVACVDSPSTFVKCTVDTVNAETGSAYRYCGGLIGSTATYSDIDDEAIQTGIVTVQFCVVNDTTIKTTANQMCQKFGGLIGYLTDGGTVTDCYVSGITGARNTNSQHIGGLIGYIPNNRGLAPVVKNCYVKEATLSGKHSLSETIGNCIAKDKTGIQSIWYCTNCTINRNTTTANIFDCGAKGKEELYFKNGEIAYMLNTTGDERGESSGYWAQGDGEPIFADENHKAAIKVIFQRLGRLVACYTNAEGKVDPIPDPDTGYQWLELPEDGIFTQNTWVYEAGIDGFVFPTTPDGSSWADHSFTETDYYIYDADQFVAFARAARAQSLSGITVHLAKDIDLSTVKDYAGVGNADTAFCGTFDGHGYTISNLNNSATSALFRSIGCADCPATIKNFTLENVEVTSSAAGRAVVVSEYTGVGNQISNVHVVNATGNFKGNNCGIIAGAGTTADATVLVSGCTVTDATLIFAGDAASTVENWGIILGKDESGVSRIESCTVKNSTISVADSYLYNTGVILGWANGTTEIENCKVDGCSIVSASVTDATDRNIGGIAGYLQCVAATTEGEAAKEGIMKDCTVNNTNITITGPASRVGLLAGYTEGGNIKNNTVSGSGISITGTEGAESKQIGGAIGYIYVTPADIYNCTVDNVSIEIDGLLKSVGGIVGLSGGTASGTTIKECEVKNSASLIKGTYSSSNKSESNYYVGGVAGQITGVVRATNVKVQGVNITLKHLLKRGGLFAGTITGNSGSTITSCSVENSNITAFEAASNDYSCNNMSGFVGYVSSPSKFTSCSVKTVGVKTGRNASYLGGIIGNNEIAVITINRCEVNDCEISSISNRKCNNVGGVIGSLYQGGTVTNCYVTNFRNGVVNAANGTKGLNGSADSVGGLIGKIVDNTGKETAIKNCYVQNSTLTGVDKKTSVMVGTIGTDAATADNRNFENNYYYNCTVQTAASNVASSITDSNVLTAFTATTDMPYPEFNCDSFEVYGITEDADDVARLTSLTREESLAYSLNTTNGGENHTGSWAQGETNPILADDTHAPAAYVTYTSNIGGTFYYIFPLKADGTPDFTNGETRKLVETEIAKDDEDLRQTNPTVDNTYFQYVEDYGTIYKQTFTSTPYTTGTEPAAGGDFVWQYPESGNTKDVTITPVARTAWDYNGDTELNVADLVHKKKVDAKKATNYACKIGYNATVTPVNTGIANNEYDENTSYTVDSYLDAARIRRLILTPPSTEITVMSYNIYYQPPENIDDTERQQRISDYLFEESGADLIALQEVNGSYWQDVLYENYLEPDVNADGSKTYKKYKQVGLGRYGAKFCNEQPGTNESGYYNPKDSFSLIVYNSEVYEYQSGDNGTIYLSDTPKVPSYGWDELMDAGFYDDGEKERAANWAIFTHKETGEKVMFVNVHLANSTTEMNKQDIREKQMELILREIRKEIVIRTSGSKSGKSDGNYKLAMPSGGMPIIIAGDFNSYYRYDAYSQTISEQYSDTRKTALTTSEELGSYNHWTDTSNFAYGDHIFTKGAGTVSSFTVDQPTITGTDDNTYHLSDHCPIYANIDVGTDYLQSTTEELNGVDYLEWFGLKSS